MPSANTFVKMFNTLTGFTYRGLPCLAIAFGEGGSPHKFTPMPGVHNSFERDVYFAAAPPTPLKLGVRPIANYKKMG